MDLVLTLSCPDRIGIVYAVTGALVEHGCTIVTSNQFGDERSSLFFMRVRVRGEPGTTVVDALRGDLGTVASRFRMTWELHDSRERPRMLVMVSRQGHCLNDLLYRHRTGSLNVDIAAVVSNHRDLEGLVAWHDIPFHHLPVTDATRADAEASLLGLTDSYDAEVVVLARYMQVLSPSLCQKLAGRIINIHHSLLPSFKGARPYQQAYEKGVKIIGATAHYVTPKLDEGPIIEQEFVRVDHTYDAQRLIATGRDLEALALARAIEWHFDRRVLLNGDRTVVFR
ncbi:MAG: formyltetrahydrofolate deformylase [Actinomycetota bacterium]|jgi:formyltetrahydrofolate deformylase|nr:formyltetrahydrofolate deformylase [Actinomycetota bacterium]